MAVASPVWKSTVTAWSVVPVKVTVNCTVSPSSADASAMDSVGNGESSSVIVPVPVASRSDAPDAPLSSTVNASVSSRSSSFTVGTVTVLLLSPRSKRNVPDVAA